MTSIKDTLLPPIHKEGFKFIGLFAGVTFLAALFLPKIIFFICLVLTIWCYYFFRDCPRYVPQKKGVVVSSADGVVCAVDKAVPPAELGLSPDTMTRVGVFMNVFNCHVNRLPVAGTIKKIAYHKGQFLNASLDKASQKNERNSLIVHSEDGYDVGVVQIAGLVARRIVCEVSESAVLRRGERFGIIRFGSRVDIYLPDEFIPTVTVGQICIAGETMIASNKILEEEKFIKI